MDQSQHLRQVCANAIRQLTQAEQKAKQVRDSASQQRQAALDSIRQQHTQKRQKAEELLKSIQALAQKGDQVLSTISLTPRTSPGVPPLAPGIGPDALVVLLNQHYTEAQAALTNLQTTASDLVVERQKWWKFW